jgi:hypothetical protein
LMIPDPQKRNRRKAGVPFLRVRKGFGECSSPSRPKDATLPAGRTTPERCIIEKLILTAIREASAYVREDKKQFIRIVRDAASAGQEQTAREQKKRIGELDELIKKAIRGERHREREQNRLRMRRVREAQRAAKVAEKVSLPAG